MDIVQRILNLLLAHLYEMTEHAIEGLDDHDFTLNDMLACLASGQLKRSHRRGRKYEIEGKAVDGRGMRVVCRLIRQRYVRIITIYEVR